MQEMKSKKGKMNEEEIINEINKIKEYLANIKLLEVYRYGSLALLKIMLLTLLGLVFLIVLITTIPLWWLKYIQKLLSNFGDVIEEVMNL